MVNANIHTPDWLQQREAILEELNEGVVIADDQPRVIFANEAVLRLGRYQRSEIQGRYSQQKISPTSWRARIPQATERLFLAVVNQAISDVLENGKEAKEAERWLLSKDFDALDRLFAGPVKQMASHYEKEISEALNSD